MVPRTRADRRRRRGHRGWRHEPGNFTAALGIPTLDGLGADGKGAHAAYEQIYFSSLMPRTYLCARLLETLA